ncbi:unnamed protein product [Dovyalis caffra]|uniref:J domain-containing protein n=1 Tax=Dovyalis caffra TaxID=77055 RepID=A0AAV1RWT8_9ROSI|nr:unnamed protein product [Dovyalis caffra]
MSSSSRCSTRNRNRKRMLSTSACLGKKRQSSILDHFQLAGRVTRSRTCSNVSDVLVLGSDVLPLPVNGGKDFCPDVDCGNVENVADALPVRCKEEADIGSDWEERANKVLQQRFGYNSLKGLQKEALAAWVAHQEYCLVLAATGSVVSIYNSVSKNKEMGFAYIKNREAMKGKRTRQDPVTISLLFISTLLSSPRSTMMPVSALSIDEKLDTGAADISLEEEASRLLKEVEESSFYSRFREQIKTSQTFQHNLKRVLGSHSYVVMVIYALGIMDVDYRSQHQLAVALLLKRDFSHWIDEIEVFDPIFSPRDVVVLKKLGCKVLSVDEKCRRQVEKPTLFFMPYPSFHFFSNLMEANLCPFKINQLILLSNNLDNVMKLVRNSDPDKLYAAFTKVTMQTVESIQKYWKEIKVCTNYTNRNTLTISEFSWYFFDVKHNIDMKSLIPGFSRNVRLEMGRQLDKMKNSDGFAECERVLEPIIKSNVSYQNQKVLMRPLYKYRKFPYPPPAKWVKLSRSGKGNDEGGHAGYGGIFYSETEKSIATFNGSLGQMNATAASIEAIKHGFRCLQFDRENINCVIHHVYEEANLPAIVLAKEGSKNDVHGRESTKPSEGFEMFGSKWNLEDEVLGFPLSTSSAYTVLGVDSGCSTAAIKAAFRAKVKQFHPDVNKDGKVSDVMIRRIIQAYEILSNYSRSEIIERECLDPFEEPECEAFDIFVNEFLCIGKGCPSSCVQRAPHAFTHASSTGTARATSQGHGEDYQVQLAVGQCPRSCIHYVTPSQRIILEELLDSILDVPYDCSAEADLLYSLIVKASTVVPTLYVQILCSAYDSKHNSEVQSLQ